MSAAYEFAGFRFEPANGRLLRGSEPQHLEPKALRLLEVLLESAGELVERDALLDRVWAGVVVTPGALTRLIVDLRRVLEDDPAKPRFIATVHTRGYRWVAPAQRAPSDPRRSNLPERVMRLIGRDSDLAQLAALRREVRLITVAGPGGSGKTQLACEFGRREVERSRDSFIWVDLSSAVDSPSCNRLVAAALDTREREDVSFEVALSLAIGERTLTLLLDNCERVALRVATLVRALLVRCPHLSVLCTSQTTLDLPEESVYWLSPLAVPPDSWTSAEDPVSALLAVDSVRLLVECARAVNPSFALDAGNAAAIAGICSRLDGLPLALELAAARLSSLAPQQLLGALDDRFALLARQHSAADARMRSLRAAIEWSYNLLDEAERDVLDRFGVFTGSFSSAAAHAVASDGTDSRVDVANRIQTLVQNSLLTVQRGSSEFRYRLLDSVALFARARLEATGKLDETQLRHAIYFTELVRQADAELLQQNQAIWHRRLVVEWPNVSAAFEWARGSAPHRRLACQLIAGLRFFWGEAVQWLRNPGELEAEGSGAERARFLNALAWIQLFSLQISDSRATARDAEREAVSAGDRWEAGYALAIQGWSAALLGDAEGARAISPRAIRLADDVGHPWLRAAAHLGRMFAALHDEAYGAAAADAREVATNAQRAGEMFMTRFGLTYVGFAEYLSGDLSGASRTYLPLAEGMRGIRSFRARAPMMELAAYLTIDDARAADGVHLLGAADRLRELTGAPLLRPWHAPHQRAITCSRAALGVDAFDRAWREGRRTEADDALHNAIGVFAERARRSDSAPPNTGDRVARPSR